jgi:predicted permease
VPVVRIDPAASGMSTVRADYARPLAMLGALVALVLLIACVNLALLFSAQSAARGRELSLRASIGAGRLRLAQLAIVECAMLGLAAVVIGGLFSAWAAPFVVAHAAAPESPISIGMPFDLRVLALAAALTVATLVLISIWPAWRAWHTRPIDSADGGTGRETGRPVAAGLVVAQVAFGTFVLLVAGLAVGTFRQLVSRPLGFVQDHVLILEVTSVRPRPLARWTQLADSIGALPGTTSVSLAGWPMLAGRSWNGFVSVDGAPAAPVLADFLNVSPSFFESMTMPMVAGRTFLPSDTQPGAAVVNETFARMFLAGGPAVGRRIAKDNDPYTVVGVVRDAVYRDMHAPVLPVAFVPFRQADSPSRPQAIGTAAIHVRVADGAATTDAIRSAVRASGSDFRLLSIRTAQSLEDAQLVRERLMAMLAGFFGVASAILVGLGLYGTLHYGVVRRRREIAIRRAVGARGANVVWLLARGSVVALLAGTVLGIASGYVATGAAESLFYGVRRSDATTLVLPAIAMIGIGLIASLMPLLRAVRVNPVSILRGD